MTPGKFTIHFAGDDVDGSELRHQLRLVVEIPLCTGFYKSQVVGLGISEPSTVPQMKPCNLIDFGVGALGEFPHIFACKGGAVRCPENLP